MNQKLVIFDWDGTLMDSQAKIVGTMKLAFQQEGLDVPDEKAVKNIIGISLVPAIARLLPDNDIVLAEKLAEHYKDIYMSLDTTPCPLFDGVVELLTSLQHQNQLMAVATGKARRGLERAWEQSGIKEFFTFSRCADEAQSKPHPEMLHQILHKMNLTVDDAIMVGDSAFDMQMAEAIGMRSIAVTYGVQEKHILEALNPSYIVENVKELSTLLVAN